MTDYKVLYQKFLNQDCSSEEAETLLNYFLTEQGDREMVKLIKATLEKRIIPVLTVEDEASVKKNKLRIMRAIYPVKPIVRMLKLYLSAAAAVLLVIGIWFYTSYNFNHTFITGAAGDGRYKDLPPGKMGATLTLANGKNIKLADAVNGQLAQEAGITITKGAEGKLIYEVTSSPMTSRNDRSEKKQLLNTLSTAKGETYQVRLPDGSKVWLNAASSLSYASALSQNAHRRVKLIGEAYFEVATSYTLLSGRKTKQPFIVESNGQEVEVLGTHFNISSYTDDRTIKTTLLEGSVRISAPLSSGTRNVTLKPFQQATLTDNNQLTVKEKVDVNIAVAWKDGDFIFRQEPLENIMRQVARWYNVDVEYQTDVKNLKFDGMVSRSKNISSVLKTIALTEKVHFKVEGRRVTVID